MVCASCMSCVPHSPFHANGSERFALCAGRDSIVVACCLLRVACYAHMVDVACCIFTSPCCMMCFACCMLHVSIDARCRCSCSSPDRSLSTATTKIPCDSKQKTNKQTNKQIVPFRRRRRRHRALLATNKRASEWTPYAAALLWVRRCATGLRRATSKQRWRAPSGRRSPTRPKISCVVQYGLVFCVNRMRARRRLRCGARSGAL